jgi:hypothetical protein
MLAWKTTMPKQPAAPGGRLNLTLALALVCLSIALLALAAYSTSFGAGFPLDNEGLILRDSRVHALTAGNLSAIVQHSYWWPTAESGLYRPVTTLSYLFNYTVLGEAGNPAGYHWVNFALHALNALLIFALTRRLTGSLQIAGWTAAVWAVHPVLTESVTNIAVSGFISPSANPARSASGRRLSG